jgi:hypothetical protein
VPKEMLILTVIGGIIMGIGEIKRKYVRFMNGKREEKIW